MATTVLNRIGTDRAHATGGAVVTRHDPADERALVCTAPESTAADVAAATEAALQAFDSWAARPPSARAQVLERAAAVLDASAEAWAFDIVREAGKPLADARFELTRSAANLRLYAGEAMRVTGRTFAPEEPGSTLSLTVGPVGVVGVITPWNFPMNLASRKIGPALAAGNTVVFKPSPVAPLTGDHLAEAFEQAGLPPGVLNVVHGVEAGRHLVEEERVTAVTFTGSTAVGARIMASVGLGRRVQLELGGNNPIVVLDDADLDVATAVVVRSSFSLSGQACTGAGRVLATPGIHDALVEAVAARASRLVMGPGLMTGTDMGPLVDRRAQAAMADAVAASVAQGALVRAGGAVPVDDALRHGSFFPATVLSDVTPSMPVAAEEVFGPVIGIERVADLDEAIARCNDSELGLVAGLCSTSLRAAQRFSAEVEAGMIKVNQPTVGVAANAPFGGMKRSATELSREQLGPTVMDFYCRTRLVSIAS